VTFNSDGKITQIRQSWDQGCLLKQVEVIGRSGANWPIRDAKEQINLITKCVQGQGAAAAATQTLPTRSRGGSTNAMRDPHATLELFAPREELESTPATVVSPYAGRRPRQRSFTEILGDEPQDPESPTDGRNRSESPSKASVSRTRPRQRSFTEILGDEPVDEPGSPSEGRGRSHSPGKVIAPKVGAGKNFQPQRIFDEEVADDTPETHERKPSAGRFVRPDPKKYEHFDFDDGSETPAPPAPKPATGKKTVHESSWSFEDFTTPQKPIAMKGGHRARDIRHWGPDNELLPNTPNPNAPVPKPRRDNEAHFEFVDDGEQTEEQRSRPTRSSVHSKHLFENRLPITDDAKDDVPEKPSVKVANAKDRLKDFGAHFDLTDSSPHHNGTSEPAKVPEHRKKAVSMIQPSWAPHDESPQKENSKPGGKLGPDEHRIAIGGDGMGGKKGSSRAWFTGEDEEPAPVKKSRGPPAKSDNFWDF